VRVLLAEDEPLSLRLLQVTLTGWGYDVVTVTNGVDAWRLLETNDVPALAIIDWMMPGMDGLELCRRVRANRREPYVYLVLLTERQASGDAVLGLKSGADDFMTKPFDDEELRARLQAGERIVSLHAELIAARDAMRTLAVVDPLTGLPNRSAILHTLSKEMSRARREHAPLAVAMADIDHFKQINDAHGHLSGDAVLREVATRMQGALRTYEAAGRFGGEEFLLILPACDGEKGMLVAERVRSAVAGATIDIGGSGIAVTCSVGVAAMNGGDRLAPLDLVSTADAALYQAKADGRNRVAARDAHRAPVQG
jgi:two-component system, cell cycle response regulator